MRYGTSSVLWTKRQSVGVALHQFRQVCSTLGTCQEWFVLQRPTDCSPFCLISRQGDSEIAISDNKSLESRRV